MTLFALPFEMTICKLKNASLFGIDKDFFFICKTDKEISLVCKTEDTPDCVTAREDGWRAMRFEGILDFSLIGILSKISKILAENEIGIFVVSTFDTDYVLVKSENFDRAKNALIKSGYQFA